MQKIGQQSERFVARYAAKCSDISVFHAILPFVANLMRDWEVGNCTFNIDGCDCVLLKIETANELANLILVLFVFWHFNVSVCEW